MKLKQIKKKVAMVLKKSKIFYSLQTQNELLEYNDLVPYLNNDKIVGIILEKKEDKFFLHKVFIFS